MINLKLCGLQCYKLGWAGCTGTILAAGGVSRQTEAFLGMSIRIMTQMCRCSVILNECMSSCETFWERKPEQMLTVAWLMRFFCLSASGGCDVVQTVEAGYRANFRPRFDGWICQAAGPSRDTNTYSVPLRLCRAAGLQSEMRCLGIYARMCVCVCVCQFEKRTIFSFTSCHKSFVLFPLLP